MNNEIDAFGMTRQGRQRATNEDQFLIATLAKELILEQTTLTDSLTNDATRSVPGKVLLVADGVGGHAAGGHASSLAAEAAIRYLVEAIPWFLSLSLDHRDDCEAELSRVFHHSNQAVLAAARAEPEHAGMATTLTMAWLIWPRCYVVHAGDSRCYLFRQGKLRRITQDHTVGAALAGRSEIEVAEHLAGALTNVVGGHGERIDPEVTRLELNPGDLLLLCTDGLFRDLNEEAIEGLLAEADSTAEELCSLLLSASRREGEAIDDTTVIVARASPDD